MKKNLMFLIGQLRTGGAERTVYNLCNELKDEYNITLVVRRMDNAEYIPDVNIVTIPELSTSKTWKGIIKLRSLKKKLQIDTCISFLLKYNVYNYLSHYKEKVVFSVRNYITDNTYIHKEKNLKLYKKYIKKADLIVNVSETVRLDSINNFKTEASKNIVIPNFCELELINKEMKKALPKEHRELFNGLVVLAAGRYSFQKGQWHLIRAFKRVVSEVSDAHLILIGRGEYEEYYRRLVKELNLENNVFILDHTDKIYRYMYNSQIYILNSFYEGMPNVILEAFACGVAVIGTDVPGGTKELLASNAKLTEYVTKITKEKYGILIPACDRILYEASEPLTHEEGMIADAILMLIKDKKLRAYYKEQSKIRINDFKKDDILNMWKNII